jgi:hypothetical protein
VANTSTKINVIERNIAKLESENKENFISHNSAFASKQLSQRCESEIEGLRKQIISTIKILKLQTQPFVFSSSAFEEMMSNCSSSLIVLVKSLCESLLEPLQMIFAEVFKDIDRKLKSFANKVVTVVHKMENIMIKVENDKLREKSITMAIFH